MAEGVAADFRERPFLSRKEQERGRYGEDVTPSVKIHEESQLHDGLGFRQWMLAGSVAGMVEHMAMFPVDLVKTRMQMLQSAGGSAHSTVYKAFFAIVKKEGPLGLYRGIGAMGLGAGPAHAVYFAAYETLKERLGGNRSGYHPLAHAAAGAGATIASDAVFTPMDVVKQRLQLRHSPYHGVMDCIRKTMKEDGLLAFYRSYRTTVVMNIPFTAVHFAAYEAGKNVLADLYPQHADEEHLLMHITAGGAAGALASAVTTPLDVIKTRLQCQSIATVLSSVFGSSNVTIPISPHMGVNGSDRYASGSVLAAARSIVKREGASSLWRGMRPRVLFHTPAAAICWSTYEAGKTFLQRWNDDNMSTGVNVLKH